MECLSSYLCNKSLLDNIKEDCESPMYSGIDERAIIFNFSDIDRTKVRYDEDNKRIVTNLGVSKVNFMINARQNPFNGTNTTVEVGDYRNTFTRTVSLFVPMDGAYASKSVLDPLSNGKFVVILKNSFINGNEDNEYQIYGFDKGLVVSSMTQTKYENNDYWVVELQEAGVMNSGMFLIYDGKKRVTTADFQLEYIPFDDEGVGRYSASITIGTRTYTWMEITGNPYIEELESNIENPGDNPIYYNTSDNDWSNLEFNYGDQVITIDGVDYTINIPANSFTFGSGCNGDYLIKQVTTEEYLCGLIDVE